MAGDGAKWEGLLKWSLSHSDGTRPSRNLSEEDRRWFMEAMQAHTIDVIKRMKEITLVMRTPEDVLEAQGVTSADIEDMLDELQEHVESIDMANDLHSIGGLVPLLAYLKNSNAGIRAKAAEVVTTIVQNNPRSQQLVMESGGLEPLLANFTSDADITVRTKSLGAISSLIRNNKPGTAAFRLANGYAGLRDALGSDSTRFQRWKMVGKLDDDSKFNHIAVQWILMVLFKSKILDAGLDCNQLTALNLIQYLLHENSSDCNVVTELGFPRLMMHLASSNDADVREAALGGLLELARDEVSGNSGVLAEEDKLKQVLQNLIAGISTMPANDLGAIREERQLVDSLWTACYNEPSSLHEKGLVVLPGEEAPQAPPDVAGRLFEPPLRAWAANRTSSDGLSSCAEKNKESPLLLGPALGGGSSSVPGSNLSPGSTSDARDDNPSSGDGMMDPKT